MIRPLCSRPVLCALLLGMLAVVGYAPLYLYPATLASLAGLFWLWQRAATPRQAFRLGYGYGLGLFGVGTGWIYVSLHDFGGMPWPLALLSTGLFCAFLALFPAAAGGLGKRYGTGHLAAFALWWVLAEWVRGWIFTGFPWLVVGYAQIPNSPLAGFAPLVGIYGVSLATAVFAALLAAWPGCVHKRRLLAGLLALWIAGSVLKQVEWSQPHGAPIRVSLLQGNIPQDLKWQPDEITRTLDTYLQLARQHPADLVVLPETALPILLERVPQSYLRSLSMTGSAGVLVGVAEKSGGHYYNSMALLGKTGTPPYRKFHLVPFGEFIPLKPVFGWIYQNWLDIPLVDLSPGPARQRPMAVADQRVAVNICYEDAFGEEIIRQLPEATLLVNASNDAWYGRSFAAHQHLQMSQARAMETARTMLRATNTGATAIIGPDGEIVAEAPHFTTLALTGTVQGHRGATPYVRFGNLPLIALLLLGIGLLWGRGKQ